MIRGFLIFLLLSVFPSLLLAQQRYTDQVFEDVSVTTFTYADKADEQLQIDVYRPEGDTDQDRPLLLYVHGGGFSGGSRDGAATVQFCREMAQKGYVTASMSYTLVMKGQSFSCDQPTPNKINTFRLAGQDIARATDFFLERQQEFGIDPQKIVLLGSSAGAEAILHAAYWDEAIREDDNRLVPEDFQYAGLVSMAGALVTLDWVTEETAIPSQFFHGTCDNLVPYGAAPHHYCSPDQPGYMPLFGAYAITQKMAALGKPYYLYTACGGKHEWAGKPLTNNVAEITDFLYHDVLMGEKRQMNIIVDTGQPACPAEYPDFNFCK
jgi:acetyl esterase/lipase